MMIIYFLHVYIYILYMVFCMRYSTKISIYYCGFLPWGCISSIIEIKISSFKWWVGIFRLFSWDIIAIISKCCNWFVIFCRCISTHTFKFSYVVFIVIIQNCGIFALITVRYLCAVSIARQASYWHIIIKTACMRFFKVVRALKIEVFICCIL